MSAEATIEAAAAPAAKPELGVYFEQLNTLRLIAVAFVLGEHWLFPLVHRLGIQGSYGVWIFFTISGYLITGILLRYKRTVEAGGATLGEALKVFYLRRFLRIFPAYYLFLLIALLIGPPAARAGLAWHAGYLSNLYFARLGNFASLGHLWSLAVEEQFYFVWPLVLLLVPRRWLPRVIVAAIVIAPLFRIAAVAWHWGLAVYVSPLACLDTLGLGALLAWMSRDGADGAGRQRLVAAAPLAMLVWPLIGFAPDPWRTIASPSVVGLGSVWLIRRCVVGVGGTVGRVLSFAPFLYLGQISYGLYLYHAVAAWLVPETIGIGRAGGTVQMCAFAAIRSVVLIAIAATSWHLFERPINHLKDRFRLGPRARAASASVSAA